MPLIRQRRWILVCAVFAATSLGGVVFVLRRPPNPVNVALDKLAGVPLAERWAHPEMLKIREMGTQGVSSLRLVLRERDSKRTRLLLWAGGKWPPLTNYVSDFPDPGKMNDRRWAACQAIRQLGPAARPAAPDLVEMLRHGDVSTFNSASTALAAIGVDDEVVDMLGALLERGEGGLVRGPIIYFLGTVQPPSDRTKRVLESALRSSDERTQKAAASVVARLGLRTEGIVGRLKELQTGGTNTLLLFSASEALWEIEKRKEDVWLPTLTVLEEEIENYNFKPFGGGSGGQGIDGPEMVYLNAGSLWAKLELTSEEKNRALNVLKQFCEKSDRIFMRMWLLPDMVKLGLPLGEAAEVCRKGLSAEEDYYRLQAANLVVTLCEKWGAQVGEKVSVPGMLGHADLGVRVAGAKVFWCMKGEEQKADVIMPILLDALDASKHQSYYYPQIQSSALQLLGSLGKEAKESVGLLRELEKDVNPNVAKLAKETREKITSENPAESR